MFVQDFLSRKQYELLGRIGEGTYARVYKARHRPSEKMVAVKVINVLKMDKKKIENALNEVRIICAIEHQNVVGYEDAFIDEVNKDLYIVMEYLGGGDLNDRISGLIKKKAYLREETVWRYAIQILQGLKALHDKKIIHRDIKPGNVFVSGDLGTLKLGDLNVSKIMREREMTATVIGTPYYLPPEIWKSQEYDYRCDVYSFGCVLYEVAALRVPFEGRNIKELFEKIQFGVLPMLPKGYSVDLYKFIKKCLTKDIGKRPTVDQLLGDSLIRVRRNLFHDIWHLDGGQVELEKLRGKRRGKSGKRSHKSGGTRGGSRGVHKSNRLRIKNIGKERRSGVNSMVDHRLELPPKKKKSSTREVENRERMLEQERILTFKVETQDLSKLNRILPSLKNSRSSSAKLFGLGARLGAEKNLHQTKTNRTRAEVTGEYEFGIQTSSTNYMAESGLGGTKSSSKTGKLQSNRQMGSFVKNQICLEINTDTDKHSRGANRRPDNTSGKSSSQFGSVSSSIMARRKARMSVQGSSKRKAVRRVISQKGSRKAFAQNAESRAQEFLKVKKKGVSGSQARMNYIRQVKEKHKRMESQRLTETEDRSGEEVSLSGSHNLKIKEVPSETDKKTDQSGCTPSNPEIVKSKTSWTGSKKKDLSRTGGIRTPNSKTSTLPLSKRCMIERKMNSPMNFEKSTLDRPGKKSVRRKTPVKRHQRKGSGYSSSKAADLSGKSNPREVDIQNSINQETSAILGSRNRDRDLNKIKLVPIDRNRKEKSSHLDEDLVIISSTKANVIEINQHSPSERHIEPMQRTGGSNLSQHDQENDVIEIEIMATIECSEEGSCLGSDTREPFETKSKPTSKRMNQKKEELYLRKIRKSRSQSYVKEQALLLSSQKHEESIEEVKEGSRGREAGVETSTVKRKTREPARGENAGKRFQINGKGNRAKRSKRKSGKETKNKEGRVKVGKQMNAKGKVHKAKLYKNQPFKNSGSSDMELARKKKVHYQAKIMRKSKFGKMRPPLVRKYGGRVIKPVKKSYFEMSTNFEKVQERTLTGEAGGKSRSKSESKHISQRKVRLAQGKKKVAQTGPRKAAKARGSKKGKKVRKTAKNPTQAGTKGKHKVPYKGRAGLNVSSFARSERAMPRMAKTKGMRGSSKKGVSMEIKKYGRLGGRLTSSQVFATGGKTKSSFEVHLQEKQKSKQRPRATHKNGERGDELDSSKESFNNLKRQSRLKYSQHPDLVYTPIKEVPEQELYTDRAHADAEKPTLPSYRGGGGMVTKDGGLVFGSGQNLSMKSGTDLVGGLGLLKPGMKLRKLRDEAQQRPTRPDNQNKEDDVGSTRKLSENGVWKRVDEKKKTIGKKGSRREIDHVRGMGSRQFSSKFQKSKKLDTPKIKKNFRKAKDPDSKFYSQKGVGKQNEPIITPRGTGEKAPRIAKRSKVSVYKRKRTKNQAQIVIKKKDAMRSQVYDGVVHSKNRNKGSRAESRNKARGIRLFDLKVAKSVQTNVIRTKGRRVPSRTDLSVHTSVTSGGKLVSVFGNQELKQTIDSIGLPRTKMMHSTNVNKSLDEFEETGELNINVHVRSVQMEAPKNSLSNFDKIIVNRTRLSEIGTEIETPKKERVDPFEHDISIEVAMKNRETQSKQREPGGHKRGKHTRGRKIKILGRLSLAVSPDSATRGTAVKNPVKVMRVASRKPVMVAKKRVRNYGDMLKKKQNYKKKKRGKERGASRVLGGSRGGAYGSSRVIDKKSRLG